MIAYHFPPLAGSSGIQRTLRFAQYLPEFGWQPLVLTAYPCAYEQTSADQLSEITQEMVVKYAFALNTAKHLAIAGKYPAFLARPDRWLTWSWGAIPAGLALIKKYRPTVIWSTYPIASAHVIGNRLRKLTGLPWVADFRDPMAQEGYPADPRTWQCYARIESDAIRHARSVVFTTPGAARLYCRRYASSLRARVAVIENGYDESSFAQLTPAGSEPLNPGRITLLHSGIVYPYERDPSALFAALADLTRRGVLQNLIIRFRACAHEAALQALAEKHGVAHLIETVPPIPYQAALQEMVRTDGLLVLQAGNCNDQIPAKLYEYLRAARPILGLTDLKGDTALTLRAAGIDTLAPLDSADAISAILVEFVSRLQQNAGPIPTPDYVAGASRRARAFELSGLLEEICGR